MGDWLRRVEYIWTMEELYKQAFDGKIVKDMVRMVQV